MTFIEIDVGFLCHSTVQSVFPVSLFYDRKHLVILLGVSTLSRELADRLEGHLFPQKAKFYSGAPTPTSPRAVYSIPA